MHDDWTQRLAILAIDTANLQKRMDKPEEALPLLHAMSEQLVSLSEDVHARSRQLHPSILDDLGLVEALRSECSSFARRNGIRVDYQPRDVPDNLSKDVSLCVYRVSQESLRNLAKYAAVKEGQIALVASDEELRLQVRDHGLGFDLDHARSEPGLGLSSMEERVRLVGGRFSITSAQGQGTTIEVRIPLTGMDA